MDGNPMLLRLLAHVKEPWTPSKSFVPSGYSQAEKVQEDLQESG